METKKYCKEIIIDELKVDTRYQRTIKDNVAKIASDFNLLKFGVPTVSKREDGFYIIDGQHRVAALRRYNETAERPIKRIWCDVIEGISVSDEAELFSGQAVYRTNVTAFDKLKAALVSGNRENHYVILHEFSRTFGVPLVQNDGRPILGIRCVELLKGYLAKSGKEAIKYIFEFYAKSQWGKNVAAYSKQVTRLIYMWYLAGKSHRTIIDFSADMSPQEIIRGIVYDGTIPTPKMLYDRVQELMGCA